MAKFLDEILDTTFDSRDIIERIDELENDNTNDDGEIVIADEEEAEEYLVLKSIQEEADGYSDFEFGVQFIRDDYFEDYAQQFAEDIGAIPQDAEWPASYIDWEAAASALQMDYTSIEIQGETYWYR